jgi:glycosyltransferase involved in cell wall biosynthesis
VSIGAIIPVKNEFGNVESIIFGASNLSMLDEIIFIDGDSTDGTLLALVESIKNNTDKRMQVIKQRQPLGKFEAIKQAIPHLKSDHVLIWDGDNTIDYLDVSKSLDFYVESSKKRDVFLVANRLTSQRESKSFRFINLVGNHFFSILMTPILNYKLPDALSGLKIFPRYLLFNHDNCSKLLTLDRYGDLTLLSLGRKHRLMFLSVSCIYRARTYGKSSIKRISGGSNLLRVVIHLFSHRCNR